MKSKYEKSMYAFYTQADNFETMLHVADQVNWVVKQLIVDFYTETVNKLNNALESREGEWKVELNGSWDWRWVKIWAYKKEWRSTEDFPLLSVAIENLQPDRRPYIGIHIGYDSKLINGDKAKEFLAQMDKVKENYKAASSEYWACWRYLDLDHNKSENLVQLLEENRKFTIENILSEFTDLLNLVEEDISTLIADKSICK